MLPEIEGLGVLRRARYDIKDVERALAEGFDPNVRWQMNNKTDGDADTPFHRSLYRKDLNVAALLLEYGADINMKSAVGKSPLHKTVDLLDHKLTRFLLERGADPNVTTEPPTFSPDKEIYREMWVPGITPLIYAVRNRNCEMVQLLIEAGARLDVIFTTGWTILDIALLDGDHSVTRILIEHGARLSNQTREFEPSLSIDLVSGARRLMGNLDVLPPPDLHGVFLCIVEQPEFLECWNAALSNATDLWCRKAALSFSRTLSQKADMPDLHNIPRSSFCLKCTQFLNTAVPDRMQISHAYQKSPREAMENDCQMCALMDQALEIDFRGRLRPIVSEDPENFVLIYFNEINPALLRGDTGSCLNLQFLSGMSTISNTVSWLLEIIDWMLNVS